MVSRFSLCCSAHKIFVCRRLFQSLAALRHIAIGGSLTGLGTGVLWSLIVGLFSLDQMFNGTEFLLSLAVPGMMGLIVWKTLKIRYLDCAADCVSDDIDPTVWTRLWGVLIHCR